VKVCKQCGLTTEVGPNQEAGMREDITLGSGLTIGLDLGDRFTEGRVLDETGEVVEAFRVRTTEAALSSRLWCYAPTRVVLEVGTHSPWVSRRLCRERYPETDLLRQVPGVGPITALYYVLTIEDPRRSPESLCLGRSPAYAPTERLFAGRASACVWARRRAGYSSHL
jgi:hypothetical protein